MNYVGFLDDTMFKRQSMVGRSNQIYDQCVVDRQLANYFNVDMVVQDPRAERLALGGKVVKGKLAFHYDGKRHENENPNKDDSFRHIGKESLERFFNIVEMVAMANGASAAELNSNLMNSILTKDLYVNESLTLSRKVVSGTIYDIDGLTAETQISLVTWFQFDVMFPDRGMDTIKIFLDRASFMEDYPYSTINNVILPCDPLYILEPSKLDGVIPAVIKSSEFSFKDLDPSIVGEDHSGLMTYMTKFLTKSKQETTLAQLLPFGILYQGAKPSSLQIREAIRKEILTGDLATESVWEAILPDLFVVAQFFIVPIWDNFTVRPNGILYPSVINAHKCETIIPKLFPEMTSKYIEDYTEYLTCGQSELFLVSIPDPLNKDEFSIQKKHPTYQLHMAQDGQSFINQDPSTREFNTRLNRAMAVACGLEVQSDVVTQEIDGNTWHSFTSAKTEYHILSKTSYAAVFGVDLY